MLHIQLPLPVKFICTFIYRDEKTYTKAKKLLERKFGKADFESQKITFDFTDYYYEEMGKPLYRRFVSFEKLRKIPNFVKIKLFCIKLEKKFSTKNRRSINIDPGYINESKLVLTTTKDFSHRIYLNKGIYAEVTLHYADKTFNYFPTTFPDYRTPQYIDIFLSIRKIYRRQIKNLNLQS
ncbi:MAG: DUF4416 domain-containing protein [Candidatus Nealsonbacteria bacterium]|nr:MAG: DUF4416 domain-containing protein [Candidatus Nealsonbacteria bacterium]